MVGHVRPVGETGEGFASGLRHVLAGRVGAVSDEPQPTTEPPAHIDLEAIDRDLAGVEVALTRLDDGSYWTDEVTGDPLDEQLLSDDPVARRNR
jgi:hypothetical protein